jgi:hypothetical protein
VGALSLSTGGSEAVHIDSSQRVGIGNSSPGSYNANDLVVGDVSGDRGITVVAGSGNSSYILFADGTGFGAYRGRIQYNHNVDQLYLGASGNTNWKIVGATGNLEMVSVGAGIDFGSGSTLSDYEEGLWSATFTPATSGTITLAGSVNALRYTIVGRVAHIQGKVDVTAVSSPVGNYVKVSLPTAVGVPDINEESGSTAGSVVVIGAAGSMNDYTLLAVEGDDHLRIYKGTASTPAATAADFNGNEEVYINATYIIS